MFIYIACKKNTLNMADEAGPSKRTRGNKNKKITVVTEEERENTVIDTGLEP
jgi:hypothetical protein